jgi:hypothetical protein
MRDSMRGNPQFQSAKKARTAKSPGPTDKPQDPGQKDLEEDPRPSGCATPSTRARGLPSLARPGRFPPPGFSEARLFLASLRRCARSTLRSPGTTADRQTPGKPPDRPADRPHGPPPCRPLGRRPALSPDCPAACLAGRAPACLAARPTGRRLLPGPPADPFA